MTPSSDIDGDELKQTNSKYGPTNHYWLKPDPLEVDER